MIVTWDPLIFESRPAEGERQTACACERKLLQMGAYLELGPAALIQDVRVRTASALVALARASASSWSSISNPPSHPQAKTVKFDPATDDDRDCRDVRLSTARRPLEGSLQVRPGRQNVHLSTTKHQPKDCPHKSGWPKPWRVERMVRLDLSRSAGSHRCDGATDDEPRPSERRVYLANQVVCTIGKTFD